MINIIKEYIRLVFNKYNRPDARDKYLEKIELSYLFGIFNLFKEIEKCPGHIIELGVGAGRNAILFGNLLKTTGQDGFARYFVRDEDLDSNNPYICPIKGDYTNSPPIMVQVGAHELLLSDSRTLKNVFERDGVTYEYKEWDELWHVFQLEAEMPESIESFKMFGSFLNKYIGVSV